MYKTAVLWEFELTHPKLTRDSKVPSEQRYWFIRQQYCHTGFLLTARFLYYCIFIFHWGYWFAVKQVTFKELVSSYCNLPCLEWLSGVCFGQHKQLYESKQFKSKNKLNRLFVYYYTLHYLEISRSHFWFSYKKISSWFDACSSTAESRGTQRQEYLQSPCTSFSAQ